MTGSHKSMEPSRALTVPVVELEVDGVEVGGQGQQVLLQGLLHEALLLLCQLQHFLLRAVGCSSALQPLFQVLQGGGLDQLLLLLLPQSQSHGHTASHDGGGHLI